VTSAAQLELSPEYVTALQDTESEAYQSLETTMVNQIALSLQVREREVRIVSIGVSAGRRHRLQDSGSIAVQVDFKIECTDCDSVSSALTSDTGKNIVASSIVNSVVFAASNSGFEEACLSTPESVLETLSVAPPAEVQIK